MLTNEQKIQQLTKDILEAESLSLDYAHKAELLKAERQKLENEVSRDQLREVLLKAQAELDAKKRELGL